MKRVGGAGERLRFEHDARGRVVRRTSAGSAGTSGIDDVYRYDGFGRLVVARNAHTTLTYAHDALDRVTPTDMVSGTARLRYDPEGRTVLEISPIRASRRCRWDVFLRSLRLRAATWLVPLVVAFSGAPHAATLSEARSSAVAWLESHQNSDGSWGSGDRRVLTTAEALLALVEAERGSAPPARRARSWLLNERPASLDYRARAIRALANAGVDVRREAAALDTMGYVPGSCPPGNSAGWGPTSEKAVNSYDSALVLSAIRTAGSAPVCQNPRLGTLNFFRRADGGWSGDWVPVVATEGSDRTITAEIVRAIAAFGPGTPAIEARNFISTNASAVPPGAAVTSQTETLEIASRLAALHAVALSDLGLENALLDDTRLTSAGVWSDTDAFLNAIGLLAIATKPGASYPSSCTNDYDCDEHLDPIDVFPHDPTEHADLDGDGIGDDADSDRDGDGFCDPGEQGGCAGEDLFADDPTEHADSNGNQIGDNDEVDADGDGLTAAEELELGSDPTLRDTDGDGVFDLQDDCPLVAEEDVDGDGVCPPLDECNEDHPDPLDLHDNDGDGICDGADDNDDSDDFEDWIELAAGSDPRDAESTPGDLPPAGDFDRDGLANAQETATSPYLADTDADGATDSYEKGIASPTDATDPSSQPRALIAVFSSASTAPPDIAGQPFEPGLASGPLRATVTAGQSSPVAQPGAPQAISAAPGLALLAGFQPQTVHARDLDGDGLSGLEEAALRTSGTNVDTDGDRFVDGAGGLVGLSRLPGGWDLDGDSTVDGEATFGTDPAAGSSHPGMAGDVAPLGHPNGRVDLADVLVETLLTRDPSIALLLDEQNEAICLDAADANADSRIDAGDLQWVVNQVLTEQP